MRHLLVAAILLIASPIPLGAQDTRYSTWSDPQAKTGGNSNAELQDFISRLNTLIDDAEKAKAADPVFLKDLRALASGTAQPWKTVALDDAFNDGNFTVNPVWGVLAGAYFIETGWGLRNKLIQAQPAQSESAGGDDLAKVLLGQILKRATGQQNTTNVAENLIVSRTKITNAFQLDFEVSSWITESHLEIGVFQGDQAAIGYRLVYSSGKGMQLIRVGSSGSSVMATSAPLTLEDKKSHAVIWIRSSDGVMRVSVDGAEVMTVTDRAFSDPFHGVRISDRGGDFIIKRITVKGT
jgi:hypothetical protein